MATLTIRNLPDSVRDALRVKAARNGRSMEAEARALIEAAVTARGVSDNAAAGFEAEPAPKSFVGAWKTDILPDGRRIPEGRLLSEDFIASRRLEAARESELITAEEWADLEAKLDAFEIDLPWVEAYLAKKHG